MKYFYLLIQQKHHLSQTIRTQKQLEYNSNHILCFEESDFVVIIFKRENHVYVKFELISE